MSSDNSRYMKEAIAAEKRKKHRVYEWCRLRNDFIDMPIWRAVARKTNVHITHVLSIVLRLEGLANRSVPRGSVADMSIVEFAAALELNPAVVARVREALEKPDIAWLDQDYVVDFHRRNPDHEDTTAVERQRRRREKLKQQREAAMAQPPPATYPHVTRDTVTSRRDTVTVTPRADQILKPAPDEILARAGPVPGETMDAEQAELWLANEGLSIVVDRMQLPLKMAETKIARWRRDRAVPADGLVSAIQGAVASTNPGRPAHFEIVVVQQLERQQREAQRGRELPFGVAGPRTIRGGGDP